MYRLIDYVTKTEVVADNLVFTGESNPWEVQIDLAEIGNRLYLDTFSKVPPSVAKYLQFLPIKDYQNFVTLNEGSSPLFKSKSIGPELGIELYFKLEARNPTGSFKDRGSAVEISVAKELGAKGIAVASTGNMAASCSCYAAAAGIPCFVFVPEDVPASKLAQVISYGGRIVQVKGNYNDAATLALDVARNLNFYLAGDYAFRLEGQKTGAFEVIDQFGMQAPDAVVVPMGCGTHLAGFYKGFLEYREIGLIDKIPQMVGVQAKGAAAIVNAFDQGLTTIKRLDKVHTVASAIAVKDPLDGRKAIDAIYASGGAAIAVSDDELLEAQYRLAKEEGLFVESSAGAAIASLKTLLPKLQGRKVVVVLCGDGLKDPTSILKVSIKPPTIGPDLSEFLALYRNSFFEGKSVAFLDKQAVVFETQPSKQELEQTLRKVFAVSYAEGYLEKIGTIIGQFLQKGKPVTFADLQDIVQDALESSNRPDQVILVVDDFEVKTGKDRKSAASVKVTISGEALKGQSEGVGPVDAVISALKSACNERLDFALTGYKVDIRSSGVDAVVYVEMKLSRNGTVSLGRGASPDIIQASIHAFEEAYNGLYRASEN